MLQLPPGTTSSQPLPLPQSRAHELTRANGPELAGVREAAAQGGARRARDPARDALAAPASRPDWGVAAQGPASTFRVTLGLQVRALAARTTSAQ